jgi:hypothetical protein
MQDVDQMLHNARVYNTGDRVPNPKYTPGSGEPVEVLLGPGQYAFPMLVPLVEAFYDRVCQYLNSREALQQVQHQVLVFRSALGDVGRTTSIVDVHELWT